MHVHDLAARTRHRWFMWVNFRPHPWNCPHGHLSPRWHAEPRCTGCGHRVMREGVRPVQTRELPAVLWPFEIASRIEARIRGHLARRGRLPL